MNLRRDNLQGKLNAKFSLLIIYGYLENGNVVQLNIMEAKIIVIGNVIEIEKRRHQYRIFIFLLSGNTCFIIKY